MQSIIYAVSRLPLVFLLTVIIANSASAQRPAQTQDDVLRTNTELVQTSITVMDKKGKFVEGLTREDFELLIDGKARPISFLERITSGSARETELSERKQPQTSVPAPTPGSSTVRGRTVIFFIDDLHLSFSSLNRTRQMIGHFLDTEMSGKDSVAIASAGGQIGFLQQFTNNKEVLQAALARVKVQPSEQRTFGMGNTPMSEFIALQIESKPDSRQNSVMTVYV